MKTTVIVEFFKPGNVLGTFNFSETYESDFKPFDTLQITSEVTEKYPQSQNNNFTIEVSQGNMWNKWLFNNRL